jgi:cysteine dioxygenase
MGRARSVRVEEFVEGLRAFERDYITKERVTEYCAERRIDDASLARYLLFRPERYTRNLVFQDPLFEVMVICWQPGQRTPVHTHNGQLGWMLVERGGVEVTNYRYVSCNAPENQNVVGIDCLGGATQLQLDELHHERVDEGGPVSTVDKIQTIHRITCPPGTGERAVSLHVYSRPFDSCIAFDLERGRCFRRNLFWDSRYGVPVESPSPVGSGP